MTLLLRFTRPIHLVLVLLTYTLGLGITHYLGTTIIPETQFVGGAVLMLLLAASGLLTAAFRPFNEPLVPDETKHERDTLRRRLLAFGVGCMGVAGMLIFFLRRAELIQLDDALLLALFAGVALANALPPARLSNRGFGEMADAFLIASFAPTIAFFLQVGSFHRLLTLFTFPLFLIFLACFLALDFSAYAEDLKYERRSLLTSLTWQQAIPIHRLLMIAAYAVLALTPFLGVSFGLVWPVLLTAPLAAYQIFMLYNISNGAMPLWAVFRLIALAIMGLTAYLILMAFWLG
jgi:1,4-dihydroxy-2-naphthoate octaprenyltransferase